MSRGMRRGAGWPLPAQGSGALAPKQIRKSVRDAIVQAAVETLGASPDASISQVADAAGVGRATLHRYFSNRDALINAIALESVRETNEAVASVDTENLDGAEALLRILEAVVPLGDRFHLLSKVAPTCGDPEVEEAYRRQLEDVEAFVGRMKEEGVFSHDVPTVWIVHIIDSLTYAAWTVVADGRVAPREVAALAHRTLLSGFGPKTR